LIRSFALQKSLIALPLYRCELGSSQDSDGGQGAAPLHPLPESEQAPTIVDSLFCFTKVAHRVAFVSMRTRLKPRFG